MTTSPDGARRLSLRRLLPIAVLVLAAVLGVSLAAVTRDLVLALLVVVIGLTAASVLQQLRQNRSMHGQVDRLRGELLATRKSLRVAAEADATSRSTEVAALATSVRRAQRLHVEKEAELSAQLAGVSDQVRNLTGVVEGQGARLLPLVERLAGVSQPKAPLTQPFSTVFGDQMLTGLELGGPAPSVNLVLNSFTSSQAFAGVNTAVFAATRAATRLRRPLRIILLREPDEPAARTAATMAELIGSAGVGGELAAPQISTPSTPLQSGYHADDLWIVTYWTTAVAIQRAVADGVTEPEKVLYLVQDWEPGFMPWGAPHVLALNTYTAGFRLVVNSTPLARFIQQEAGIEVPEQAVFGPQVDVEPIHAAARRWSPGDPRRPRVLFYARPSKPRNLFSLGVDALRLWAGQLPDGVRPVVTFAGEDLPALDVGDGLEVIRAGKTDLARYYDLLASTDLGLALMYSPHPSHLALELPMAGIPTVTNAFSTARVPWVPGLSVSAPTPDGVAAALGEAWGAASGLSRHRTEPPPSLGGSLGDAVDYTLDAIWSRR